MRENIIYEKDAHLVAGNESVPVGGLYRSTDTVGVGVCTYNDIGIVLFRERDSKLESLRLFGVWIRRRGEITVWLGLFGHDGDFFKPALAEHLRHDLRAGAVERSVDYGHVAVFAHRTLVHRVEILARDVDELYAPARDRFIEIFRLDVESLYFLDIPEYFGGGVVGDLTAVRAVHLIPVELCGIVTRGYHDTRVATEFAHHERQVRRGEQLGGYVRLDAVLGEHRRRVTRELLREIARIVAYRDRRARFFVRENIVGKPLRDLAYRVNVEPVRARAYHAAKSRGPELEIFIERFFAVIRAHRFKLRNALARISEPLLIQLLNVVFHYSSLILKKEKCTAVTLLFKIIELGL